MYRQFYLQRLIGASLSEPHTSELNSEFFIYYIYIYIYLLYVRRSVNANWHSFNPKYCAHRSVRVKYRKQLHKDRTLEPFTSAHRVKLNQRRSKKTGDGAQRDGAQHTVETADQRSKRLRNWEWGTAPNVLLKLLAKDKPLYEKYVKEGKRNLRERNEIAVDEIQTGSGKLWGERLKIIADKDQPVSSWTPTRNNITAEKHRPTRMVGSWTPPLPRGERIEIRVLKYKM